MRIRLDADGYVAGYSDDGFDMDGGVDFPGEIPEGFDALSCGFYRLEGEKLVFDAQKSREAQEREAAETELEALYQWFEGYDRQVMQYARAQRLGRAFEGDIRELDAQAEINRRRILELTKRTASVG